MIKLASPCQPALERQDYYCQFLIKDTVVLLHAAGHAGNKCRAWDSNAGPSDHQGQIIKDNAGSVLCMTHMLLMKLTYFF